MSTQSSEIPFLVAQVNDHLVGGKIIGSLRDPEMESFGFKVEHEDGKIMDVWVDRDAEGNGPGWVSIEKG